MAIKSWFPTFIYDEKLQQNGSTRLNDELLSECYTYRDLDEYGQKWSTKHYFNGYTSYASLNDLPRRSPTFEALKNKIDRHVKNYVRHLEMDLQGRRLEMTTCWINIMSRHTHHSSHLHPLSVISGTYYVSYPRGGGGIKFEDPRLSQFMASPPKKENCSPANQRFITYKPQAGRVVLFESWLKHEVPANQSDADRVSISFNYDWL